MAETRPVGVSGPNFERWMQWMSRNTNFLANLHVVQDTVIHRLEFSPVLSGMYTSWI